MVRTVITPKKQEISINLPESYIGKKVEVIVFAIEDTFEERSVLNEPLTHYASERVLGKDWLTQEEDNAWQNL